MVTRKFSEERGATGSQGHRDGVGGQSAAPDSAPCSAACRNTIIEGLHMAGLFSAPPALVAAAQAGDAARCHALLQMERQRVRDAEQQQQQQQQRQAEGAVTGSRTTTEATERDRVRALLAERDMDGRNALLWGASCSNSLPVVRCLLDALLDGTAVAAGTGTDDGSAEGAGDDDRQEASKQARKILEQQDEASWTALHCASAAGNAEVCSALLSAAVAVQRDGEQGDARLLLKRNDNDALAIHYSKGRRDVLEALMMLSAEEVQAGASRSEGAGEVKSEEAEHDRQEDDQGVLRARCREMVRATDRNRQTALHRAVLSNCDPEAVQMLVDAGAAVDAQDISGNTALHLAAEAKRDHLARVLIACDAREQLRNRDGLTAEQIRKGERPVPPERGRDRASEAAETGFGSVSSGLEL